jgi:hypothetical protein
MNDEQILTTAELVDEYGNEDQKAHFERYRKFKSISVKNAVITTALQEWGVVEDLGRGKGYKLAEKHNMKID